MRHQPITILQLSNLHKISQNLNWICMKHHQSMNNNHTYLHTSSGKRCLLTRTSLQNHWNEAVQHLLICYPFFWSIHKSCVLTNIANSLLVLIWISVQVIYLHAEDKRRQKTGAWRTTGEAAPDPHPTVPVASSASIMISSEAMLAKDLHSTPCQCFYNLPMPQCVMICHARACNNDSSLSADLIL